MPISEGHKTMGTACRHARQLLGWTELQLARSAKLKAETVRYVEGGNGRPKAPTLAAIRTALEQAGVEFIAENGGGPGVRIKKEQA
jgi:transcriptional regulator with XRE-family HTH domain